ncbi:hypothetical protein C8034_v008110 [Colletotrichum sidae]|uniref:DUF7730 domain-containing protein n=1 Tax=Colletotrichum sidae TaxID=1347389 RepID=A0A4R8TQ64_9PEZI|nr:hypothetical protein C8034_v008110 [Colletotrichum sidae]
MAPKVTAKIGKPAPNNSHPASKNGKAGSKDAKPTAKDAKPLPTAKKRKISPAAGKDNTVALPATKKQKASPATKQNAPPIGFLSLPPEIRNVIYAACFNRKTPIKLHLQGAGKLASLKQYSSDPILQAVSGNASAAQTASRSNSMLKHNPELVQGGLLLSCKTVQADVATMLYSNNSFHLDTMGQLARWLELIGPLNRSFLREIHLGQEFHAAYEAPFLGKVGYYDQTLYRAASRFVARSLSECNLATPLENRYFYTLYYLTPDYLTVRQPHSSREWINDARYLAEIFFRDFGDMMRAAYQRGKPLGEVVKMVQVDRRNFTKRRYIRTFAPNPASADAQILAQAEGEMATYLECLLRQA